MFLLPFLTGAHSSNTPRLAHWRVRKPEEKRTYGLSYLFLSFYGVIFSVSGSLTKESNISEKGYDRVPWFLCFLRIPLPSFCVRNKFRLEQKVWPLGAVRTSAYSVLGVTPNLLLFCVFSGLTRIPCPEGIGNAVCKRGLKEQWTVCCA